MLTQNHPVIDVLIEFFRVTNDKKYLRKAEKYVGFWLKNKNSKTGLIPESFKAGKVVQFKCRIDSMVDLHTNCLKLYELTGRKKYLEETISAVQAIKKYYYNDGWWYENVDSRTGEVRSHKNQTKFVGLSIRLYLLLDHVLKGGKIYDDPVIYSLSRDR